MKRTGLICINTGNGKGKTTAAIGTAIRAAGQGFNVLILQFMKGQKDVGELNALSKTDLPITIRQYGRKGFIRNKADRTIDCELARAGLKDFGEAVASGRFDLIILDEINMAIDFDLLLLDDVMAAIEQKTPELHLILTGRNARKELIEIADLVTEMKEIKHPYRKGIMAQKGIEF